MRAFGDGKGANANAQCAANGTLGDAKGLDVWTYFPSEQFSAVLDVLPKPDPPKAVDDLARRRSTPRSWSLSARGS